MSMQTRVLSSIPLLLAFAALPLTALEACDHKTPPRDGGGGAAPEAAAGCTGRRWIGKFPDGVCPKPPEGWNSDKLFQNDPLKAPAFLAGYCVYEYAGKGEPDAGAGEPDAAETAALQSAVAAESECTFAEDCGTVGPLTDPQEVEVTRRFLHDEFIQQVNGAGLPPVGAGATLATARVAVIDTKAGIQSPADPHATVVGGLIRDLTCSNPSTRCAADVTYNLGLPHLDNSTLSSSGGHFGSMSQVATAIYSAVTIWQWQNQADPTVPPANPRLVINASIGAQPGSDCGAKAEALSCSAQSAFDAIRHAACQGAIVVAAAGNSPGGPKRREPDEKGGKAREFPNEASDISGGTCPAAWTRLLSRNECEGLEGEKYDARLIEQGLAPFGLGGSGEWIDTPLLVPVAGVDSSGALLPNAREGSLPRNVALGILGTAKESSKLPFPPPMTGSSIGAASWTATAANVWAYDPELTARELIDLLHATGSPVYDTQNAVRTAVVDWDGAPSPEVRRSSACAAIAQLCGSAPRPAACPTSPIACRPLRPSPLQNRDLNALAPKFTALFGNPLLTQLSTANPSSSASPFQELQNFSTPPWVHPQPETFPCGNCALHLSASRVDIYIDSQFPSTSTIQQAMLLVNDSKGAPLGSFALNHSGMSATVTKSFAFVAPNPLPSGIAQAVMSFQVLSNGVIGSSTGTILLMQQ